MNSLKELNEQLISIKLAEEEASNLKKLLKSPSCEERLRKEAATLFDDIREYYNSAIKWDWNWQISNDAKALSYRTFDNYYQTKNFEELLTYVNKFELI